MVTRIEREIEVQGNDRKESLGLLHVYTGDGRGKTSIALGTSVRAAGSGLHIYMIQFLKSGETGEIKTIKEHIPNMHIVQYGAEALREKQAKIFDFNGLKNDTGSTKFKFMPDSEEKDAARMALEHATHILKSGNFDLLILDEVNVALDKELITMKNFREFISHNKNTEIICSGRDAPKELIDMADYVSELSNTKHPWQKGIVARKGIDY